MEGGNNKAYKSRLFISNVLLQKDELEEVSVSYYRQGFTGFYCHTIQNKTRNHSINKVMNRRVDRMLMCKQGLQVTGLYLF